MSSSSKFWGFLSIALVFLMIVAFSQFPRLQDDQADRQEAARAMKELRYRDALRALDRIIDRGASSYDDKANALTCLQKLRDDKSFARRLERFIEDEKNAFDRGRLLGWEIVRLVDENRWQNRARIYRTVEKAIEAMTPEANSPERKQLLADFILRQMRLVIDLDARQHQMIEALAERVVALKASDEASGEALFLNAGALEENRWQNNLRPDSLIDHYRVVVTGYPQTRAAARSLLAIGRLLDEMQKYTDAVAELEKVVAGWRTTEEARSAAELIKEITQPRLQLNVAGVFRSGTRPVVNLRMRNIETLSLKAFPIDLMAKVRETKSLEDLHRMVDLKSIKETAAWEVADPVAAEHAWLEKEIEAPFSGAGAYILRGEGGVLSNQILVLVSDIAAVLKHDQRTALTFITDAATGKPVGDAAILVATDYEHREVNIPVLRELAERRLYRTFTSGATDGEGIWRGELKVKEDYGPFIVIARRGSNYAIAQSYHSRWGWDAGESGKIFAYTERPVYRTGQEVFVKAVVRTRTGGVFGAVKTGDVKAVVKDPRGTEVRTLTAALNEFGTAAFTIPLAADAPLGVWSVELAAPGVSGSVSFRVEEYKKPEYTVTVTAGASQYRLGQNVDATIDARYLFGEPVANAAVEYEVRQSWSGGRYIPAGEYDWFYRRTAYRPYYGGGAIIFQGKGSTDAQGKLRFKLPVQALDNDDRPVKSYTVSVTARVTDASRRTIVGAGNTIATSHEFSAWVNTDRYAYRIGSVAKVSVTTRRFDGAPRATSGRLVLYKAEWNSDRSDYDLQRVRVQDFSTSAEGAGSATMPLEQEGYFQLRYETADAYDNVIIASSGVWVTGDRFQGAFAGSGNIEILPDKDAYIKGDTARMLVTNRFGAGWALLTIEAGRVLESRVIRLEAGASVIPLAITAAHQPNVFVKLIAVFDGAVHENSVELKVPPVEKFASITLTPSKAEFLPGEKGIWKVEARDHTGKPLAAEFSIGVVDAALYYFAKDATPDIRAFFYADTRSDSVRTTSSFEFRFYGEERQELAMAMAPAAEGAMEDRAEGLARAKSGRNGESEEEMVQPEVRSDFKDTALWLAQVKTGADGVGEVEITWPDNLTTWHTIVRAVSADTIVGSAEADVITRKNLLVRLQTPRFLVQGDEVTLSVNVHNYLKAAKAAKVLLTAEGLHIKGAVERQVNVPPGGESRIDYTAVATKPGIATVTTTAVTNEESDAMRLTLPVLVHGIERFESAAGATTGEESISLTLPEQIRQGSSKLQITVRPTVAAAMIDSLPYLVDYPYGCVEQTMSRFLPAAMVGRVLRDLGVEQPELQAKLPELIAAGLARLYDMQHGDGGWGWWKHDDSSPYMTAYVVYGLGVARGIGIEVNGERLERARAFLIGSLEKLEDEVETLNFVIFALSSSGDVPERYLNRIFDLLPRMEEYETALFAVTLDNLKKTSRFGEVMERLHGLAKVDSRYGTASWGADGGWYWYQDNVEATSLALIAELRHDPKSALVRQAARWLLSVRKGGKWKSTRDTAFALYALTDYLKASGELQPNLTATIELNGKPLKTITFTRENLFGTDGVITIPATELQAGPQKIRFVAAGSGTLWYDAFLSYFSTEEPIRAAGTTIDVERRYNRIRRSVDAAGQEVVQRTPLQEGESLISGEEIEVALTLRSRNNYEYLVYEDYKPAGCEPVALVSGMTWGSLASNMELRDDRVVFFIGWLPQGEHQITYSLRAEIPGKFHTLPTNGYAMYAPDIRAISDERRMEIRDRK
jgi:uncharacterized protein YfaS (alpha-2-macroglobulin family)